MTRNQRHWSATAAIIGLVMLFQNCGSNQNFDLSQAQQSSVGAGNLVPDSNAGDPANPIDSGLPGSSEPPPVVTLPTPTPAPPAVITGQASKGQFCARQSPTEIPKFRVSIADLSGVDLTKHGGSLDSFFAPSLRLKDLNIYLSRLNLGGIPVNLGYDLGSGQGPILRDNGTELREDFGMMYETNVQLTEDTRGYYQFAVVASGQVELEIQNADGVYVKHITALGGVDDTRFLCVKQNIFIRRGDQLGVRLRQTHARASHLTATLLWRKAGSPSEGLPSGCDNVGEFFVKGVLNAVTTTLQNILDKGWKEIPKENLTLIVDGPNLVKNGDFEDTTGLTLPSGSGWWKYFDTLPSWKAYNSAKAKFELQNNGINGFQSYRGGKNFLELDADSDVDGLLQEINVTPGKSYRQIFDYARHNSTPASTSGIEVWTVTRASGGSWAYAGPRTITPAGGNEWLTDQTRLDAGSNDQFMIKIREVENQNNNAGSLLDNVIFREIRESDAVCAGGSPQYGIKILSAKYGKSRWVDVTKHTRSACEEKSSCSFGVNNEMNGDPEPGLNKEIVVRYACLNGEMTARANEGQTINLSCP